MKIRRAFKPFVWPRFRGTTFHGNVVLNFASFPKGELAVYARAYHEAAQTLVSRMVSRHGYRDVDACPIVFLYRHALELYLKSIIYWGNSLLLLRKRRIVVKQAELFRTHSLQKLTAGVRPIFRLAGSLQNWPTPEFRSFGHFKSLVLEFERIDPGSYSFRYPIDRKGVGSLPHHFCFNVGEFGRKFDGLLSILDGAATWAYEEFQAEAEAIHSSV